VELLVLVIHESETVQRRGVVSIQRNRLLVFDDRVLVHFSRKKRIAAPLVKQRFLDVFRRHENLDLKQIAFPFFDQRRILIRQAGRRVASNLGVLSRKARRAKVETKDSVFWSLLDGAAELALRVAELALGIIESGDVAQNVRTVRLDPQGGTISRL